MREVVFAPVLERGDRGLVGVVDRSAVLDVYRVASVDVVKLYS